MNYKKRIYMLAETQYESVYRYLLKYTKIITPYTKKEENEYKIFKRYYSKYSTKQSNKACYFDESNSIIRNYCQLTNNPSYKIDIFKKLNVKNGDGLVIFSLLEDSKINTILKKTKNQTFIEDTKFINMCFHPSAKKTNKNIIKVAVIDKGINPNFFKGKIIKGIRVTTKEKYLKLDDLYYNKDIHGNVTAHIITSICTKAKLIVIKTFNENKCNIFELIKSIELAINEGAKVIFIGGAVRNTKYLKKLIDVCNYAYEKGSILVAPKDINTQERSYPCYLDNVVGVDITPFSNLILYDKTNSIVEALAKWNIDFVNDYSKILKPFDTLGGSCVAAAYLTGIICDYIANSKTINLRFEDIIEYIKGITLSSDYAKYYFNNCMNSEI